MPEPDPGALAYRTAKFHFGFILFFYTIKTKKPAKMLAGKNSWGDRWGSNPRQPESQSGTLPTELRSPLFF